MDGLVFCLGENAGVTIYPGYMTKEQRAKLRETLNGNKKMLRCGCRDDAFLYYYVSSDLRFVPAEQFYEHKEGCARGIQNRGTFVVDDTGQVRVQLKFNPLIFTTPKITSANVEDDPLSAVVLENSNADEEAFLKGTTHNKKKSEVEHPLDLEQFIQKLTYDAFNDRMLSGKAVLSCDYFNTHLYSRCKYVSIGGMKKSIRELSLKEDRAAFLFGKFSGFYETKGGATYVRVTDTFGKQRSFLIFSKTLEKEKQRFYNRYNKTLDEAFLNRTVMVSGFCYRKYNRFGEEYTVLGRACFYLEEGGVFLSSFSDVATFSLLLSYCRDMRLGFYFLLPVSEDVPYIKVCFKGLSCYGHVYLDRMLTPPPCPFVELKGRELVADTLNELLHEIKKMS